MTRGKRAYYSRPNANPSPITPVPPGFTINCNIVGFLYTFFPVVHVAVITKIIYIWQASE